MTTKAEVNVIYLLGGLDQATSEHFVLVTFVLEERKTYAS